MIFEMRYVEERATARAGYNVGAAVKRFQALATGLLIPVGDLFGIL